MHKDFGERPFVLSCGITWVATRLHVSRVAVEGTLWWQYLVDVHQRCANEFRSVRVLMPSVLSAETAREIGYSAAWAFLNNNRQCCARSRWPYPSLVVVLDAV